MPFPRIFNCDISGWAKGSHHFQRPRSVGKSVYEKNQNLKVAITEGLKPLVSRPALHKPSSVILPCITPEPKHEDDLAKGVEISNMFNDMFYKQGARILR